ncbi:putative DNA-binding mobile mystery protein A [Ereboglobus sp. PH5-10]|uniref:HTH cro/C1-type domain-containing protein n=1 Tax=Ereboglobus luteus TaxID=1796921 RepID=A0A2U8E406_9BACT|nr:MULTISPECIES: helix-turn-helix domain-containing protein [Ereboglobus]AWI09633.1 hypothetical protein CKA38_10585 [Ereboglobus luteus]MDF9828094.1 putative DNA-binding mobile mystery protein A [Ereboglobus sp. PH5-10]
MKTQLQEILLRGLDEEIEAKHDLRGKINAPAKGWLRAVREALGLSQRDIAARMRIRQQPYASMEKREADGTVSLSTLRRAADALDCELVYFLVPKEQAAKSFAELATRDDAALKHLRATEHSMALEGQAVGDLPAMPAPQSPAPENDEKTSRP